MPTPNKESLERAQLVRIHEANCKIEYPTPEEANFRLAIMKKLGAEFGLRELRKMTFSGPEPQPTRPLPPVERPPAPQAPKPKK